MQTENFVPGTQRSKEKLIKMVILREVEKRFPYSLNVSG